MAAEPTFRIANPDRVKIPAAIIVPMPIAKADVKPKSRLSSVSTCICLWWFSIYLAENIAKLEILFSVQGRKIEIILLTQYATVFQKIIDFILELNFMSIHTQKRKPLLHPSNRDL